MAEYQMTLVERREIARGTMAFWFQTNGAKYEFRAGQHADFGFMRPSEGDEGDNLRTFSLASDPHDQGLVMIAMRMRESGFKTSLKVAALGTMFMVSRPRGSFTLHKDFSRPAVYLAGGIGITPMRSVLHWASKERAPHRLYLFYSNRDVGEAAFLEEFEGLSAQNHGFTFIPTLTRPTSQAWTYERGPISGSLLTRHLPGIIGPVYYLAGPSRMVAAMNTLLHSLGVSDDDIKTEEFGEYGLDHS